MMFLILFFCYNAFFSEKKAKSSNFLRYIYIFLDLCLIIIVDKISSLFDCRYDKKIGDYVAYDNPDQNQCMLSPNTSFLNYFLPGTALFYIVLIFLLVPFRRFRGVTPKYFTASRNCSFDYLIITYRILIPIFFSLMRNQVHILILIMLTTSITRLVILNISDTFIHTIATNWLKFLISINIWVGLWIFSYLVNHT